MTAIKIVLKEIKKKREDKRWVLYTDFQSSVQSIEYNKENHPILNQIYDILADLKKSLPVRSSPTQECGGNEEANKAAKQSVNMPGVTTTKQPYTDY